MATEFKEPRVGSHVIEYLVRVEADIKLIVAFTAFAMAFIFIPVLNGTIVRPIMGLAMVYFIPGYSLVAALFPRKEDLSLLERAAFSIGMCIAVVSLTGIVLNFTPWGISHSLIVALLALFSIVLAAIANHRRHELPADERFSIDFTRLYSMARGIFHADKTIPDRALTILLAISIVAAALTAAYVIMNPDTGEKFTAFYILGPDGKADNYPLQFAPGAEKPVTVGIVNHEHRNTTYDLIVNLNDSTGSATLYTERLTLTDNSTVERSVNITSGHSGDGMKADFLLYKDGNMTAPCRECYFYVNVTGKK